MPADADAMIEREVRIAASPDTVFRYFIDPERMRRWMGRHVELDPTPGGRLRIDYNGEDIVAGSYLEVDPPHRVIFTWGWEMPGDPVPPGASTVEVTLAADGDGTILRLVHRDLPAESRDGHAAGWDQFLPALVAAASQPYGPVVTNRTAIRTRMANQPPTIPATAVTIARDGS